MREVPRRSFVTGCALALLLAGCGTTNLSGAMQAADARAAAIYADCDAQLRSGRLTSYRQAVECARQPVITAYAQNGYPFMDLVLFDLQERGVGAARIDVGSAKPEDVQRDIAELERRLDAERDRRMAARTGLGGSVGVALPPQLLAGLTTLQEQTPRQGSNCFSVGGFTHCNNQSVGPQ